MGIFDPISTVNIDEDSDSPRLARGDLLKLVQGYNALLSDAWLIFTVDPIVVPIVSGSLNFATAATLVRVSRYGQDETSLWTISKVDVDCTSTYTSGQLSISALTKDNGYVTVTAIRSGYTPLSRRLLITRSQTTASAIVADLTPPPDVAGFSVNAGVDTLYATITAPVYLQGRGNAQTNIYGATYASTPVLFTDPSVKNIASIPGNQTFISIATEPATNWCLWAKHLSKDGVESVNAIPLVGVSPNGVQVSTSADMTKMLAALNARITTSELATSLSSEIALISAPSATSNSVNQRLAALQSSVQASGATSFEPIRLWDFSSTVDGWTSGDATLSVNSTFVTLAATGSSPTFTSPVLAVNGAVHDKLRARVRRTAGSGWVGVAAYSTAGHAIGGSFYATQLNNPALNTWVTLEWDMSALTLGGTDWITNTITGLQLQLGATSADTFQVDWVSIGRSGVGASYVALEVEASTRALETGHLGSQFAIRTTVASDGRVVAGGMGLSGTSVPGQGPTIDFGVMANTFWVAAPSGSGVNSAAIFTIQTTDTVDGTTGQLEPKGVYIESAFIKNLSALWGRFGTLIATSIQATSISASQLTLGTGIIGGILRSSNYSAGISGWMIDPSGTAQLPSTSILGQVTASQIDGRGLTIRDPAGNILLNAGSGTMNWSVLSGVPASVLSNLIDTSAWRDGLTGNIGGFLNSTAPFGGFSGTVLQAVPDRSIGTVWRCVSGTDSNSPTGGWNGQAAPFSIDNTKTYRFSVWFRLLSGTTGNVYLGPEPYLSSLVQNLNGVVNTNPYFMDASRVSFAIGQWYLAVGYVMPVGYAGIAPITGQIYNGTTGMAERSTVTFRWDPSASTAVHRSFTYYNTTAGEETVLWGPTVVLCDGTEPSVDEMLSTSVTSRITAAASTAAWSSVTGRPVNLSALSGSESIRNDLVTISSTGVLQGIGTPNVVIDNSQVGAVNFLWGSQIGPHQVNPGTYGTAFAYLKDDAIGSNLYALQPNDMLTISADLSQNAISAGAGQRAELYLFAADSLGNWIVTAASASTLSQTPVRVSATFVLPSNPAFMYSVGWGLWHGPGVVTAGTVFANRVQIERGGAATTFKPGFQPGATVGGTLGVNVRDSTGGVLQDQNVLNSYSILGQNRIPNSDQFLKMSFNSTTAGFNPGGATFSVDTQYASNLWAESSNSYTLKGGLIRNLVVQQNNVIAGGDSAIAVDLYPLGSSSAILQVEPGIRYGFSVYVNCHRTSYTLDISWKDVNGAEIGFVESTRANTSGGLGYALSQYHRGFVYGDAPPNSVGAVLILRKYNTSAGETNSYMRWAAPQFEAMSPLATQPSPYNSGPVHSASQVGYSGDLDAQRNSRITINSSGVIEGIGSAGRTVDNSFITLSGLGGRAMATIDQITSANVSTYIAGAAIDLAKINIASIGTLSALSSFMGTVEIATGGYVRSGQSAFGVGNGFWLGTVGGVPQLSIGDSANNILTYNGTSLVLRGTIYASAGLIGGVVIQSNSLRSSNYAPGVLGWAINADGSADFSAGVTFGGTLKVGASPTISGTTMTGTGAVINTNGSLALGKPSKNIVITSDGEGYLNGAWVTGGNILGTIPVAKIDLGGLAVTIPGGAINQSVVSGASFGPASIGTRSVSITGGTAPVSITWALIPDAEPNAANIWINGSTETSSVTLYATCSSGGDSGVTVRATARDSVGITATASFRATIVSLS